MAPLPVLEMNVIQLPFFNIIGINRELFLKFFISNLNILNALKTFFDINHIIPGDSDSLTLS